MSRYACTIIDNTPCNPAQRMYVDLGDYRYGLTVVGEGEPLVCLHGFSESSYTWDTIQLPGYRMIRIDTIGHGDSDIPDDENAFTICRMLEDLHTVMYHMAGESYHLMGYSMGARMALLYGLQYGHEVRNLILESGSAGIQSEQMRAERCAADSLLSDEIACNDGCWFAVRWAQAPIFESQQQLSPEVRSLLYRRRAHNSPYALAASLQGAGQGVMPYVGQRLDELCMPCLYISGELDTKYTTIGRDIFGILPNCQHVIVEGAGHNVHLEQPHAFAHAVLNFLHKKG